ncbi:scaffold prohead core protein [Acinetobacter phage SH-Ab 15599]|nr:scaffold prohead core protein [Acinetobacter phage SH-Ab 15599]
MSQVIVALLAEAKIDEALADKIVEAFEQKLEEGITNGVETRLVEEQQKWALTQATLVEDAINGIVDGWAAANTSLLENSVKAEIVNESIDAIRNLVGFKPEEFNESVNQYAEGKISTLNGTIDTIQSQLDEQTKLNEEMTKELVGFRRAEIFAEATEDLSELSCDKIQEALEKQEFDADEQFKSFVVSLAEAHRPAKTVEGTPDTSVDTVATQAQINEQTDLAGQGGTQTQTQKPVSLVEATLAQMNGVKS